MKVIDIHVHYHAGKDGEPNIGNEKYLKAMDKFDVEAALLLSVSYEDNESIARVIKMHPDRFFGAGFIDLREPGFKNIERVKKYVEYGFKFIKMFPNYGFDPNDEKHEQFWQAVEDNGLGCMAHCGWLNPRKDKTAVSCLTATPYHFEIPARRHPGVNFIFAHFGGAAAYLETVVLISRLKNTFGDVTPGWGKWVFEQRMPGLTGLDFTHVMYGTDNKNELSGQYSYGEDIKWWTETLQSRGCNEKEISDFFYNNAARLLGIIKPLE